MGSIFVNFIDIEHFISEGAGVSFAFSFILFVLATA
jgi:hypothetical protein